MSVKCMFSVIKECQCVCQSVMRAAQSLWMPPPLDCFVILNLFPKLQHISLTTLTHSHPEACLHTHVHTQTSHLTDIKLMQPKDDRRVPLEKLTSKWHIYSKRVEHSCQSRAAVMMKSLNWAKLIYLFIYLFHSISLLSFADLFGQESRLLSPV